MGGQNKQAYFLSPWASPLSFKAILLLMDTYLDNFEYSEGSVRDKIMYFYKVSLPSACLFGFFLDKAMSRKPAEHAMLSQANQSPYWV